jgi:hypothetical protein
VFTGRNPTKSAAGILRGKAIHDEVSRERRVRARSRSRRFQSTTRGLPSGGPFFARRDLQLIFVESRFLDEERQRNASLAVSHSVTTD